MPPTSNILYNPADYAAPNLLLPEEVFGHVDLGTLADIHRYLCESELQEDIELATWMWESYLNGLWKGSPTAEIRTAQAFSKLDRAYRRVRSLTNKAQDKWPFFDRNFKQMSSATVRNNARGEAAPGIMYPIDGLQRKSHLAGLPSNASTTPNTSAGPELQVPFGTTGPSRYQPHVQNSPRPTRQTPGSLLPDPPAKSSEPPNSENRSIPSEEPPYSATSSQNITKSTDVVSESEGQAKPQSELSHSNVSRKEGAPDQDMSQNPQVAFVSSTVGGTVSRRSSSKSIEDQEVEPPVRDAGAGKVRGPNGRYLPKDDIAPGPKKTKKPKKGAQMRKSMRNMEKKESPVPISASEEPHVAPADDEGTSVHVGSPSPPASSQEVEEQKLIEDNTDVFSETGVLSPPTTDVIAPPPATVNESAVSGEKEVVSHKSPVPAYLLAAEAEAVPSNLDRLPPNARKPNKRKSEPTVQSGDRKRGKHGNIIGRPRKSEQRKAHGSHQEPIQPQNETATGIEEPPQRTTRRATRRSAVADLSNSTSSDPTAKPTAMLGIDLPVEAPTLESSKSSKGPLSPEKSSAGDEDEVMGGVDEDATATHEKTLASTSNPVEVRFTPSCTSEGLSLPQVSDDHQSNVGVDRTSSPALPQPASRQPPYQSPYQTIPSPPPSAFVAKKTRSNGRGSVHTPGQVEYFARITTGNGGTMDLPIEEDRLESDEVKMIKKYAKYNAETDVVSVSYTQFRQIFAFAKQD